MARVLVCCNEQQTQCGQPCHALGGLWLKGIDGGLP
jgi:hypothetical protein